MNLYSYGLNNPLRYTDPDGHYPEDDVPTFRATGTGYSGLSLLDELLYRSFLNSLNAAQQIGQQAQQMAQQALDWLSAPRDPGCMQKAAVLGAGAGAVIGGGAGGLGGGAPGGLVGSIVPVAGTAAGIAGGGALGIAGGASLGSAIGYGGGLAIGFAACMSSTGSGGGQSANSGSGNQKFWKDLRPFRGKTKTNGLTGKSRRFYEWDHTHNDVEVYDSRGNHLGSADPETGNMTKPAVPGRRIDI